MNSSSIASCNGWVELEVTLIEGVEWGGEVSFYTTVGGEWSVMSKPFNPL